MAHPRTPEQLARHRESERLRRPFRIVTPAQRERRNELARNYARVKQVARGYKYAKGPVLTMDRDTCIYLAGLFDGEGSFMISTSTDRKGGVKFNARARIGMSHRPTIEWIAEKIGRSVQRHGLGRNAPQNAKPIYRVSVENAEGIISFTEQLLPFLITKREAAEVILNFCRSRRASGQQLGKLRGYSDGDAALVSDLKEINRFGVRRTEAA